MTEKEIIQFENLLFELKSIRTTKSNDYGNSWKVFGLIGIIYQIGSKFIRIWNLKNKTPENESLRDSFRDGAIYNIMAMQLIDNKETEPKI